LTLLAASKRLSLTLITRTVAASGLIITALLMVGSATTANVVPQTQSVVQKGVVLQAGKNIGAALFGALGTLPKDNLAKLAVGLFGGVIGNSIGGKVGKSAGSDHGQEILYSVGSTQFVITQPGATFAPGQEVWVGHASGTVRLIAVK
jgi:hypothetical protein